MVCAEAVFPQGAFQPRHLVGHLYSGDNVHCEIYRACPYRGYPPRQGIRVDLSKLINLRE